MQKVLQFASLPDFVAHAVANGMGPAFIKLDTRGPWPPKIRIKASNQHSVAVFAKPVYGGPIDQAERLSKIKHYLVRKGLKLGGGSLLQTGDDQP